MILIVELINIGCGVFLLYLLYRLFYPTFLRRGVKQYGKEVKLQREQARELEKIRRGR